MIKINKIKYDVSKEYSTVEGFVLSIPENFESIGTIIQNNRNVIKKVNYQGENFVIKDFKGMYFFNRLAYSIIRKSKSERSFVHSSLLKKKSFNTPPNVAWIDCYQWGLLARSYYVSVFTPLDTCRLLLEKHMHRGEEVEKLALLRKIAFFAYCLHLSDVYHQDFSLTNILVDKTSADFHFSLVDLNRMRFVKPGYRKRLQNFRNMDLSENDLNIVVAEYARLSGQSKDTSIDLFWKDRSQLRLFRRIRRTIRNYTLTPLENLFLKGS